MSQARYASRLNLTAQFPPEISFGGETNLRVLLVWGWPTVTRPDPRNCGRAGYRWRRSKGVGGRRGETAVAARTQDLGCTGTAIP